MKGGECAFHVSVVRMAWVGVMEMNECMAWLCIEFVIWVVSGG